MRVVAAVIEADSRDATPAVWAFRRGPGRAHAGLYEFPGGKVEPGETDEAALARELAEELSVVATVGAKIHERQAMHAPGKPFDIAFYRVHVDTDPSAKLVDHDDAQKVGLDQLDTLSWAPGDETFIHLLPELWTDALAPESGALPQS